MKIGYFRDEFFFLSNFYPIKIEIDGKTYRSSEHYYQACKAMSESDHDKIRNTVTPAYSKRAARRIKSFNPDWDNLRMGVMYKVLKAKFSIPEMRVGLIATDGFELEEGNNWGDKFWGTVDGNGCNMLGKLLMQIRDELKKEAGILGVSPITGQVVYEPIGKSTLTSEQIDSAIKKARNET